MGLFGSKKKTYANTSVSRMIEDKDIKNEATVATLSYVLDGSTRVDALASSYIDTLKSIRATSLGTRSLGTYNWALNKYAYGVPKGNLIIKDAVDFKTELSNFLTTQGISNQVQYSKFGPLNNLHFAYKILIDDYGFDIDSNEVTTESTRLGVKVYLEDITISYIQETINDVVDIDMLNGLGYAGNSGYTPKRAQDRTRPVKPFTVDTSAKNDYVIFSFTADGTVYTVVKDFLKWEFSGSQDAADASVVPTNYDYYMGRYIDTTTGKTTLFTYQFGSGKYTALDNLFVTDAALGKYVPNIYLCLNSKKLNAKDLANTDEYKSSVVLCNRLGFKYNDLVNQVYEGVGDTSKVTEMFLSYRLPANTQDPKIIEYMYQYFFEMYKSLPDSSNVGSNSTGLNRDMIKGYSKGDASFVVQDKGSNLTISFKGIKYEDSFKVIGKIGTVAHSLDSFKTVQNSRPLGNILVTKVHTYSKQITDTVVRTVSVYGLTTVQSISDHYGSTAAGDDEHLMIPIDIDLVRKRYRRYENELITKAMYFVINTVQVIKQKWYQTGIFKLVMFIVAVVLAYPSGGSSMAWYLAVMQAVAYAIAVSIAIQLAARLLVNVLGINAGIVLAVLAIIAMVAGAYSTLSDLPVAGMNAVQLMQVVNTSFAISNSAYALEAKNRNKAFLEFASQSEQDIQAITDKRKELGLDNPQITRYDLLARPITTPDIRVGELPNNFLERTLTINVGWYPIEIVQSYVVMNTQLPTVQQVMAKLNNSKEGNVYG